jgi:clan AA aspartic protease
MIVGAIRNLEASIPLQITGSRGKSVQIDAVVDTGFNGYPTLPRATVAALDLTFAGNRRGTLADGSVAILDVFLATVIWHESEREILISQTVGTPLAGMSLLEGSRLSMHVVEGAPIEIEELPD